MIAVVFQQWMYGIWNIIFQVVSIRLLSTTFLGGDKSHSYTEAWSRSYETLCDYLCMLSSLNILSIVMTQLNNSHLIDSLFFSVVLFASGQNQKWTLFLYLWWKSFCGSCLCGLLVVINKTHSVNIQGRSDRPKVAFRSLCSVRSGLPAVCFCQE